MRVTALLVSHNGARWLPAVLEGLVAQTRRPDLVVAVDTGSSDASVDLLEARLAPGSVVSAPARTTFPEAVDLGLDHIEPSHHDEDDWVWLLHDDSRPAPDALQRLLEVAGANRSVSILGPKHREWPSLRRLLEVGITMSGTGRRETGLERGEYDQGQHDRLREVLAVGSAGMLVRRAVLEELGGFDRRLPMFGNDLDLGWRAARAGHRTMVVPDAVVFHVEAASRGIRRTPVVGNHHRNERRSALYTLLVNCSLAALPFLTVRLLFGSLLRALGFLLVRAPKESFDELAALTTAYLRPDRIMAGRAARRRTSTVPPREVRHLLAPFWLPYRHGLDFLSDIATAVVHQASDASAARRISRSAVSESGPEAEEAQSLPADTGLLARLISSPTAWLFAVLVLLALVGARGLVGSGLLGGGALLPAPSSASAWWRLYLESWHDIGVGSAAPAAPYLLPLALAGMLLFGKAWMVVDLVFLFCVPLAAFGAFRFLRTVVGRGWPALWGTAAYALFPVLAGAVAQGRLGTVVAAVVLPWVANAALYLSPVQPSDRRWRAAWRTALLLGLLAAFVPVAWVLAAVLALLAVAAGLAFAPATWRQPRTWGPLAVALGVVPVLLLPWTLQRLGGGPTSWYAEAGLPAGDLVADLGVWQLLGGRPTSVDLGAAPAWLSVGIAVAAAAALLRRGTRSAVILAWAGVLVGLAAAVLLDARGEWAGFPLLLAEGAAVTAVAMAGTGIGAQLSGRSFGWRQPVGLVVLAAALLAPVVGALWWVAAGVPGPLDRGPATRVPAYMTDAALADPVDGILVVRSEGTGLGYSLLRGAGARLGEDTVATHGATQDDLTALVADLASAPTAGKVAELSRYGVRFVYLSPPADREVAGKLDSVSGLRPASALRPGSRAWELESAPSRAALAERQSSYRPPLLLLQGLALVAAVVLAAPSRRVRR